MIYAIFQAARDAMKAKGCPFEIAYGPARVPIAVGATRVQFGRDPQGDSLGPARGPQLNPRTLATRSMGAIAVVYAHSTLAGATLHDHEDLADLIVDQLQIEIYRAARNAKCPYRATRAGFTDRYATPDGWSGAVYELRFAIDRGVRDVTWPGAAAPEGSFAHGLTAIGIASPEGSSTDLPTATTRIQ